MARRSREGQVAIWSIRALRGLNLFVICGCIAFLVFEIQFEPHPAEFGWSLIMIAIITVLSGLIGYVSSGKTGCFVPHMFFIFTSLMGLFSISVLLFVRPDEVARKMLSFTISLSTALHHLYLDAYMFSFLGFLQLFVFLLAYIVHSRAYVDFLEDVEISSIQPQFSDKHQATDKTSAATRNISCKQSSCSKWKSQLDGFIFKESDTDQEGETLRSKRRPFRPSASGLPGDPKLRLGWLSNQICSRSLRGAGAVVAVVTPGRVGDNEGIFQNEGTVPHPRNPRMTSRYSSSAKLESCANERSEGSSSGSTSISNAWTDSDSTVSSGRWQYSIDGCGAPTKISEITLPNRIAGWKDEPVLENLELDNEDASNVMALDVKFSHPISRKVTEAVEAGITADTQGEHCTSSQPRIRLCSDSGRISSAEGIPKYECV